MGSTHLIHGCKEKEVVKIHGATWNYKYQNEISTFIIASERKNELYKNHRKSDLFL
jgi:hypothetical protein